MNAAPPQHSLNSPRTWTGSPDARAREALALARLWLAEPVEGGDVAAAEYHRLFLEGVPPYASAFLDERGFASWSHEPCAWWPESWRPPAWVRAAATDHIGVSLLALAASASPDSGGTAKDQPLLDRTAAKDVSAGTRADANEHVSAGSAAAVHLASWAPVATLALRSHSPRPPYDDLVERTEALLLSSLGASVSSAGYDAWPFPPDASEDEELTLRAVVGWLAVPRCAGWGLTLPDTTRMAGALDLPAARTGGRRDALASLFHSAGRDGKVTGLLSALDSEAARAQAHYGRLASDWPAWTEVGRAWAAQVARTRGFVTRLGALAVAGLGQGNPVAHRSTGDESRSSGADESEQ